MQKASKTVAKSKPSKAQPEDFKSSKGKTKRVTVAEEDSESEDEPEEEGRYLEEILWGLAMCTGRTHNEARGAGMTVRCGKGE